MNIEKNRTALILEYFKKEMPNPRTELEYNSTFQLLIAVMLSAQCTDVRVNQVTPSLFKKYPTVHDLANAKFEDIKLLINNISYPNSKAKHIIKTSQIIVDKFYGEIPDKLEELLVLPGVGRKTANVVLSIAYGKATLAVDTHVFRVSHRLGLVTPEDNTPNKVEKTLLNTIDISDITMLHHWLLLHGRYVCTSKKPHCQTCGLISLCPQRFENSKIR